MPNKLLKVSAVAFVLALGSGCAQVTREEFESVKSTANTALSEARAAKSAADSAASAAASAQSTADSALRAAEEAKACCDRNSEKIDRLFKEKMKK